MSIAKASAAGFILASIIAASATAQQPPPPQIPAAKPCTLSSQEIAANRQVALKFFTTTGDERVALADPSYIQHNPAFKKRAEDNKVSDFEEFKAGFSTAALAARAGGAGARAGGPPASGPQPPAGNPFEVVTTECDVTTVVHKTYRPDPTSPGKFYAAYTFDTFRVKNGKLVEHWDGAVINPPAPAAPPAPPPPSAPR